MPKDGFTVITVSIALKDRLASTAMEMGFKGVPRLLDAFLNGTSNGTSTAKCPISPPLLEQSLGRELNPRPPPYQGGAPPD